jgi:hypothetical protein
MNNFGRCYFIVAGVLMLTHGANAYVGPGFAVGALESVIALCFGFGMLLVGACYYPAKKAVLWCHATLKGRNVQTIRLKP